MYHLLLFFHVRPPNQPTITGVALCPTKVGDPCPRVNLGPQVSNFISLLFFLLFLLFSSLRLFILSSASGDNSTGVDREAEP